MRFIMLKKNFKIDNSIYPENIIHQMIMDFADFSIIYLWWEIIIEWENENQVNEIFWEGVNYMIAMINENI